MKPPIIKSVKVPTDAEMVAHMRTQGHGSEVDRENAIMSQALKSKNWVTVQADNKYIQLFLPREQHGNPTSFYVSDLVVGRFAEGPMFANGPNRYGSCSVQYERMIKRTMIGDATQMRLATDDDLRLVFRLMLAHGIEKFDWKEQCLYEM
jgi:hypothetical protein